MKKIWFYLTNIYNNSKLNVKLVIIKFTSTPFPHGM